MSNSSSAGIKKALLIGNRDFDDLRLNLQSPLDDVYQLRQVLMTPTIGGFDDVTILTNETEKGIRLAVSNFLGQAKADDFLLLYFSSHGLLDDIGHLYLAARETDKKILRATSVAAAFLIEEMDSCYSTRQVLVLDCCYSGAFQPGSKGESVINQNTFQGNGYGRMVLTATNSTQVATEDSDLSLYTRFLIQGLSTGEADFDGDGWISVYDWHKYAEAKVLSRQKSQSPRFWSYNTSGNLFIARSSLLKDQSDKSKVPADNPPNVDPTIQATREQPIKVNIVNDNPTLEWCDIRPGSTLVYGTVTALNGFFIGKYPVTNAEFNRFIESSRGYFDDEWWDFSKEALAWRRQNNLPAEPVFKNPTHPRVNICWFEAVAYTRWLSDQIRLDITLPTEAQWQLAAHGSEKRLYPWGNFFDPTRCNTLESGINATTPVSKYFSGRSACGVYDMAGNVWELCINLFGEIENFSLYGTGSRAVKGGAWLYKKEYALIASNEDADPAFRSPYSGFRIVYKNRRL